MRLGLEPNPEAVIADTLEQNGWVVATLWKREDWCCFNIRRS